MAKSLILLCLILAFNIYLAKGQDVRYCKELYISDDPVFEFSEILEHSGNTYLATWGAGLFRYNAEKDTLIELNNQHLYIGPLVLFKGKILVRVHKKGLYEYDPRGNQYIPITSRQDTNVAKLLCVGKYLFVHLYDDGIYRTEDLKSWKRINRNIDKEKEIYSHHYQAFFSTAVTMQNRNDTLFFQSGSGKTYLSTDYGESWKLFPQSVKAGRLSLIATKAGFFTSNFGIGLYYTTHGQKWDTLCKIGPCRVISDMHYRNNELYFTAQFAEDGYDGGAYRLSIQNPTPVKLWSDEIVGLGYGIYPLALSNEFLIVSNTKNLTRTTHVHRCRLKE